MGLQRLYYSFSRQEMISSDSMVSGPCWGVVAFTAHLNTLMVFRSIAYQSGMFSSAVLILQFILHFIFPQWLMIILWVWFCLCLLALA